MIHLENIAAITDPKGNGILLSWINPEDMGVTGVHIRRRTKTHSLSLDDGEEVVVGDDQQSAIDTGLKGDTVYYYSLFPYQGNPSDIVIDRHNRTSALAVSPMGYSEYMYNLLPTIYHRYDKIIPSEPDKVDIADLQKGQLRRYLDIIGGQLDVMHGYAKAAKNFQDIPQIDGDILPLLAKWIGWKLDLKRELEGQRNEIRNAPTLFKTIGIIPTVQHTVKRISGWESKTKEFVHNVFFSNRPERLNLWQLLRKNTGEWSKAPTLFSLDYAFEGRPSFVTDNHQVRWLFYHTQRNGVWEIWYKTTPSFELNLSVLEHLLVYDADDKKAVQLAFQQANINLDEGSTVSQLGNLWKIDDSTNSKSYLVTPGKTKLIVFKLSEDEKLYSPSKPLISSNNINKYPSTTLHSDSLWLFWSEYDTEQNIWHIHYRIRTDGSWSNIDPTDDTNPFRTADVIDNTTPRYKPNAVVDRDGDLWLFWLERSHQGWQMKYNKRTGGSWGSTALTLSAGSVGQFRIDADPYVLMANLNTGPQIYVFWARNVPTGATNQSRWHIDLQVKTDLTFDDLNWHGVYTLPKDPADEGYHDREPMAVINSAGGIEFFCSSNLEGNWAVWWRTLTSIDTGDNTVDWGIAERITQSVHSSRDPLPITLSDGRVLLLVRSNESIKRSSKTYEAMETLDARFAGSTTQHVRNLPKRILRRKYEDFETYTFDTGQQGKRNDQNWYARDTVGLYLETDTMDNDRIHAEVERLRPVVTEFMPMTDRAVYITRSDIHAEHIYTYGQPPSAESRYIVSTYNDEFTSVLEESVLAPNEDFTDSLL